MPFAKYWVANTNSLLETMNVDAW